VTLRGPATRPIEAGSKKAPGHFQEMAGGHFLELFGAIFCLLCLFSAFCGLFGFLALGFLVLFLVFGDFLRPFGLLWAFVGLLGLFGFGLFGFGGLVVFWGALGAFWGWSSLTGAGGGLQVGGLDLAEKVTEIVCFWRFLVK